MWHQAYRKANSGFECAKMATHSVEDLARKVEICGQVGKELGLIK